MTVEEEARIRFNANRWFKIPFELFRLQLDTAEGPKKLEYGCVILLGYLIWKHFWIDEGDETKLEAGAATEVRDGWFYCKGSDIEKKLGMTIDSQTYLLSKLVRYDLIHTERRGMPPMRFIKIDFAKILSGVSR